MACYSLLDHIKDNHEAFFRLEEDGKLEPVGIMRKRRCRCGLQVAACSLLGVVPGGEVFELLKNFEIEVVPATKPKPAHHHGSFPLFFSDVAETLFTC